MNCLVCQETAEECFDAGFIASTVNHGFQTLEKTMPAKIQAFKKFGYVYINKKKSLLTHVREISCLPQPEALEFEGSAQYLAVPIYILVR